MPGEALVFLLQALKEWRTYKDLKDGERRELQLLEDELRKLEAFLNDSAMKSEKSQLFKKMEKQIRELAYDVEDTIEMCLTKKKKKAAAKAKTVGRFLNKFSFSTSMAKEVKSLREERVRVILSLINNYFRMTDMPSTSLELSHTEVKLFRPTRSDKVVGFEDEKATIIGYLTEPKEKLDVISIIGMHGQGKTTLAREIYHDERISDEFPIRIWNPISQTSENRDMFLNILKVFSSQDMSSLSDQELIETSQACLEREKFLLVLDGVRTLDDWNAIQKILPRSNGRSKVLITACDNYLGADDHRKPDDKLRLLTSQESWKLLQLEVFGNLELDLPWELEEIGKIIADKCRGLPLQIVVVGGILAGQLMKSNDLGSIKTEWQKVSENENLFMHNGKSISDAIELTYSTLPDDLRECFLYMGVFPEDYEIPVWKLTYLWIAEGFVRPGESGQSLEETAIQNLYGLVSRNLVMADNINPIGEVKTCRIHDMIREFCVHKALERNMFQDLKRLDYGVSQIRNCRRLCVHSESDVNVFLSKVPKIQQVRSVLGFHKELALSGPRYFSSISNAFILLRVLESKYIKINHFPTRITEAIHLKYITMSVDDLHILPKSLSKLWNLQTLVVDTASHVITMEADIWGFIGLRHLKTNAAIVLLSEGKGKAGENLQTLNTLSPESCTPDVSKRAKNLKTLRIKGELSTLSGNSFLENFDCLEKLKLVNDLYSYQSPVHGHPLPNSYPPNLRCLTLSNTFLKWSHMSTLAKIETLKVLKLKDNAFTGIYWSVEGNCFHRLQFLLIANTDLVIWEASADSLPSLTCLVLKNCGNLNEFPVNLKSLEKLEIERVNKSALIFARRIAEQKAKSRLPFKLSIAPGHAC